MGLIDDDRPHEPDPEPDPEPDLEPEEFDPASLGPDVPEAPEPEITESNTHVVRLFWKLVVVFNVAILALAIGVMLVAFRGQWDLGLQVFLLGVLTAAYGGARYYRFRRQRDAADESDDP